MNDDAIIEEAVKLAQKRASEMGLTLGQTVAHPDEPVACDLLSVEGDMATIGWGDIRRTFPLRELFDPNVGAAKAGAAPTAQTIPAAHAEGVGSRAIGSATPPPNRPASATPGTTD